MIRFALFLTLAVLTHPIHAFELKGISPGMEVEKLDLKGCAPVTNADSGVPGFRCQTTLGGDQAELRVLVFEEKVVGAIFAVKNALMTPVLDALKAKYGAPHQRNRYIEDYSWRTGQLSLTAKERRLDRGFDVIMLDFSLYERARAANADKAKKDI